MELDEFLRRASAKDRYKAGAHGASDQEIHNLEVALSATLPPTYRRFLSKAAFVRWFGTEVFGITGSAQNDTFLRTRSEREHALQFRDGVSEVPRFGNIIGEIFGGGYAFLHALESPRAGHVSAHAPDEAYKEVQYWPSIEEYFEYLIAKPRVLRNTSVWSSDAQV